MALPEVLFEIFDVVDVCETARTLELEVAGSDGVVLGVSAAETVDSENAYAVDVAGIGQTVMLLESELRSTGRRVDRADVYDGSSVRVSDRGEVPGADSSDAT